MRHWRILLAAGLVAATAACQDTPLESQCCRVVGAIELAPAAPPTLVVGDSIQFTATVLDVDNDPIETDVTFGVSDGDLGSITTEGMFKATADGTLFVRAVLGTVRDSVAVTIEP